MRLTNESALRFILLTAMALCLWLGHEWGKRKADEWWKDNPVVRYVHAPIITVTSSSVATQYTWYPNGTDIHCFQGTATVTTEGMRP